MMRLRRLLPRILSFASLLVCLGTVAVAQTGPAITITPTTMNFLQVQGGKFAQGTFTITNTGDATLTGTVETPGGVFQIVDGDGSFSLAPGGFRVVTLRFTPSSALEFSDTITITHNATAQTSPAHVVVTGTGIDGEVGSADTVAIGVSPGTLAFNDVMVGQTAQRTVYITNMSDEAALIGSVGVASSPSFVVESGMGAFALAPGEVRPVTVRFVPTMAQAYADSLAIVYSGTTGVETVSVQLTGAGTAMPLPNVSFSVTPEVVFFGNVAVGDTGVRSVIITNTSGTATLAGTIGTTSMGSSFTADGGMSSTFTLAPGAVQVVPLTFVPTASGMQRDSIVLTLAGVETPTVIQLVGSGVVVNTGGGQEQVIGIAPATLSFGNATVGTTTQQQFTVTNPSTSTPLVIAVSNPSFPFFIQGAAAGAATIAPGESRTFTVSYTPTIAGSFTDNLMIGYASGENIGSSFVALSGTATAAVSGIADEGTATGLAIASFPEPTTAATTLRYATASSDDVRLSIFDARGREVARLVDGATEAGEHTVRWDADGQPAGVYVVQLRTGSGVATGRITVVR